MRQTLINRLTTCLQDEPTVHALWLEGADAYGHADRYSDIDLWADVDAGNEAQVFRTVRAALLEFGPLATDYAVAHPHSQISQRFFQVEGMSPFCFVDLCLQHHGRVFDFRPQDLFLTLFDRDGLLEKARAAGAAWVEEREAIVDRSQELQSARWRAVLVAKEAARGNLLEALSYYHEEVLRPLVELLRLRYCPGKHEYHLKHVYRDLPPMVAAELERLYSVVGLEELPTACERAAALFENTLVTIINTDKRQPSA